MKPSGTDKDKRHTLQWWMVPKCDEFRQWWWGYQKVRMIVLPESEKQKYLKTMDISPKSGENPS